MSNEIKVEKTIFELLQEVRYELSKTELKKSGHNGFQNFDYFELKDFLPTTTKLFYERGMCPLFNIVADANGIEIARLDIVKGAERVSFQMPTAEPGGNNAIQSAGSKQTYMRRYLYLSALDLVENDLVDAHDNSKDVKVEPKATPKQVEMVKNLYDVANEENLKSMLTYCGIEKLEDLTVKQASDLIKRKAK